MITTAKFFLQNLRDTTQHWILACGLREQIWRRQLEMLGLVGAIEGLVEH